ncbi:maleylacetoacetate isomerase [Ferrimonas gelatinilytica]|uniref:Maleylacetoacetate isomerase n=1 Tax=Ferrimonas gelatinilytica TaxID=1255257 RepID=A0ABP9RS88_9GAMM
MKLYGYFRSSAAYRVRLALNLKGIAYESVPVNLLAGEQRLSDYAAINPQRLVPALELDGGQVLTQSGAILEYLEQSHPEPALLPSDPLEAAQVRAWCQLIGCDIHPICNLRVLNYLKAELGVDDAGKEAWIRHWIEEGFGVLEQGLSTSPSYRPERLSWLQVYLIPQVFNALRFGVDMNAFPTLQASYEACNRLPEFIAAQPGNQPDSV